MAERSVCVLGEPRLVWDGGERLITGRPGRVLVAMLVGDGGASLDQLAELVWSGDPPDTARSALHVHLGALRKIFAGAPPGLAIERRADRYLVARVGWDLDVELVAELTEKAKELLAVGAPEAAVDQLRHALDLWRGVPYTVSGAEVSATATYQHELARLELEELLVEALLAAGQGGDAELLAVRLVDAEPYREHRWAQLMRSQVFQGRAGEALVTFERVRELLDRELGVGPGEQLTLLERSVLTRNLAADVDRPATAVDAGDIPAPLGELVGRSRLLDRVETLLAQLVPVSVTGAPGAGKTRLAVEVARRSSSARRAVCWVDLRNAAFDPRISGDDVLRFARRHPGGLIVFDNAERSTNDVSEVVSTCRRSAPSVQLLVTSRVPVPGPFASVTVGPLDLPRGDVPGRSERSASVRLLRSLLALLAPEVELERDAAAALCRQLGGLPLAIRMAADLARSVPVGELALASRVRLGPDLEPAVADALEHLGRDCADAFGALCVVAGQLDGDMAAALIAGEHGAGRISRLVDAGLVQFALGVDAPYSVPEPLRDIGVTLIDDADRRVVLDRLADECLARARTRALPSATTPGGRRLEDLLKRELPWHRQALDHLVGIADDDRALDLVAALELQLYSLGWWAENRALQDSALSIPGPPSRLRAHVLAVRGRPGLFHQFDEQDNQLALAMATEIDDDESLARAQYHLGVIRWWSGHYAEALDRFERGKLAAERAGHLFLVGENVRFTGMTNVTAGNVDIGLEIQLGLLHAVERMSGMEMLVPHLLMHLGHSRRHLGDLDAALADLSRARDAFEAFGNQASLIHVCSGLAEVYADLGRHDESLEAAARSLEVSAGGVITVYDPWTLCTTARVHVATGETDLARRAGNSAVEAMGRTFDGEIHRVAVELAWVGAGLNDHRSALRLAGLAGATPDRREIPFRSPLEQRRLGEAVAAAREVVGDDSEAIIAAGAGSTLAEAAAFLLHRG